MKRIISIFITLALSLALVFSLGACKEIDLGSEIKRVNFVLEFYDENGESETTTVTVKLYTTFAPETTKHILDLVEDGYYNGLCVSNVTSSYAQFGDYKFGDDGKLVRVDEKISTVKGEFHNAGTTGNRLSLSEGVLLLNRDKGNDSGKASLVACLSTSAPFDADDYCLLGKFVSDDADSEADSSSIEALTSLGKIKRLANLVSSDSGKKFYYVVNDSSETDSLTGKYFTYDGYEDEMYYYDGLFSESDIQKGEKQSFVLSDDEVTALEKKLNSGDGKFEYITLPVYNVIIKSASLAK